MTGIKRPSTGRVRYIFNSKAMKRTLTSLRVENFKAVKDLRDNKDGGLDAFAGLLETLQVILPYARDLDFLVGGLFGRQVALQLHEGSFTVPGWMLSTGSLRLVALLALLRHPHPPSLICVEEIENGLDPRTIHLVVDEILRATDAGRTQIMVTTHSPYLLDLVPLESLVLVTRDEGQPPRFERPAKYEQASPEVCGCRGRALRRRAVRARVRRLGSHTV